MKVVVWFLWHAALGEGGNNERSWLRKDGLLQSFSRTKNEARSKLQYAQENTGVSNWRPQQIKLERVS